MQIQKTNNTPAFGCFKCDMAKKIGINAGNTVEAMDKFVRETEQKAKDEFNKSSSLGRLFKFGQVKKEFSHDQFAEELLINVKKMFGVK